MSSIDNTRSAPRTARPTEILRQLMYHDPIVFVSQLVDPDGRPLKIPAHIKEWLRLMTDNRRLVLLGPRDHSKTTTSVGFVLWLFFRHATERRSTRRAQGGGSPYLVLLLSGTELQAEELMRRFRDLLAANAWLFPHGRPSEAWLERPPSASQSRIRLASGGELVIGAYGTSLRGMHPNLILMDDVLTEENTRSERKRAWAYEYLSRTLLPMNPERILLVGTAMHTADLLHRLKPRSEAPEDRIQGFAWHRFRAFNERTGRALWPGRHSSVELVRFRDQDPAAFSREFMNDPRDNVSSYFPRELTQAAVDAGAGLTLLPMYRRPANEFVVLGADIAISSRAGADYLVVMVMAVDRVSRQRRLIAVRRLKGLDIEQQIELFVDLAIRYSVGLAIIEDNGLQRWLLDELGKRPGGHVFFGHTTDRTRSRFDADGIPILNYALLRGLWVVPSGDEPSRNFARVWQAELGAFGWRDGRIEGVGEHDDTVIASWLAELAARAVDRSLDEPPQEEIVYMEDEFPGWKPVRIGEDY